MLPNQDKKYVVLFLKKSKSEVKFDTNKEKINKNHLVLVKEDKKRKNPNLVFRSGWTENKKFPNLSSFFVLLTKKSKSIQTKFFVPFGYTENNNYPNRNNVLRFGS